GKSAPASRRCAAAEAEAMSAAQRRTVALLEQISRSMDVVAGGLTTVEAKLAAEAVEVAVAVARKLTPALLAREPLSEITALASECLRHLNTAPHLVVRVNDGLQDTARKELDAIAHARGFSGRLVILGEPNLPPGDCRIEWADGGVVRSRAEIDALIDELVRRYLTSRRGDATQAETSATARHNSAGALEIDVWSNKT
ncbi:MAG TPA: FliH/SctL family protein, partial [Xanthobacteraceae bacterium]|nr:FliH/SctL family protein [Xanthobacteraceae bacterium]